MLPYSQGIVLAFPPPASGVSKFGTDLVWFWLSTLALTWSPSMQVVTREGRGEKQHIWDGGSPLQVASVYEGHCPEKESSRLRCELGSLGRKECSCSLLLSASPSGGTGVECHHTISGTAPGLLVWSPAVSPITLACL